MANERQPWAIREDDEDFDAKAVYGKKVVILTLQFKFKCFIISNIENVKCFTCSDIYRLVLKEGQSYGSFIRKGGREHILGIISYVDLIDMNGFLVQTVNDIVKELGYSATDVRYYNFLKPETKLDYGFVALGSDQDVKELVKYVVRNKVIEVYIEHDSTILDTYYNGPRVRVLTNDNRPASRSDSEGVTKLYLQTPSSSKHLTIGEEMQLKYEERVRKGIIPKEGPFNPRPGVIYLGNHPLLRPGEIPWLEMEDCKEDIGCGSRNGKETKRKSILGGVEKEADTEFKINNDIEHEEEYFEMNDDTDGFVDEQNMTEDVPVNMQPFKNDMERIDALLRICDIK
nr:hypothetical protein [Tanacetum cinerariifolium]